MGGVNVETTMLGVFLDNYEEFRRRLRRRLRSDDLVDDVLQETYLRVERLDPNAERATHPTGYLFRMALNMAADHHRSSGRLLTGEEVDELIQGVDALLQLQAPEDAGCFCRARGRFAAGAGQREIEAGLLAAYRRDCLEAGWLERGFITVLGEVTGIDRIQRMSAELAHMRTQDGALATFSND